MTRKDYIIIAKILNTQYNAAKSAAEFTLVAIAIQDFISELKQENSRFDEDKFINACIEVK